MPAFTDLVDLAAARVGGEAIVASDDFFAGRDNLLKPGRGVFIEDKFTENGKWMDGWESRRKRVAGHDWCVVRLGLPGIIAGFDVDTNHFLGNFPESCSVEACVVAKDADAFFPTVDDAKWVEVLPKSRLKGGSQNLFEIDNARRWTHVRLNIFPDGGVARFRVHGVVVPDWKAIKAQSSLVDLASVCNGGVVLECSDQFFGPRNNLIMPGRAPNMGDGWETRRKRRGSYDELMASPEWLILRLGRAGVVCKIEVDTNHFKGNFPESCQIEGVLLRGGAPNASDYASLKWKTLLPRTKLEASTRHFFKGEVADCGTVNHLRLKIFPDGGVSRLRIYCEPR